jgi:uncharacterized protein YjbI with pentapeptide repeats
MSNSPSAPAAISDLEKAARQAETVEILVRVDLNGKDVELMLNSYKSVPDWVDTCIAQWKPEGYRRSHARVPTFADAMANLAAQVTGGTLRFDSVQVKTSKSPVKNAELKGLALAAWCSALGIEPPAGASLKKAMAEGRKSAGQQVEKLVALLRSGKQGIAEWNSREAEVARIRKLHHVDLSGQDMRGAIFRGIDFQGASFDNANLSDIEFQVAKDAKRAFWCVGNDASFMYADLSGAKLGNTKFEKANFVGANLQGAHLCNCTFKDAILKQARLRQADLSGAKLQGANLEGADLTDARLARTEYDETTLLPEGFTPPREMNWKGKKISAALLKTVIASAQPLDFDAFFQQLQTRVDSDRLDKALKMLKADRFQLYAEAKEDSLTGVVKSQSDASLVYSCRLASDGSFACCTQNLNVCGGLRGALCKHLLVLIIGLAKAGQVDPTSLDVWIQASRLQKPLLDKDAMSETFLRYKGAEAGEVDWRPTETIPEDYYAM